MAALDDSVKQFIVQALACFDTPSQIAAAVRVEFGLAVSRQQVATYDPTKYNGQYLSLKWRAIFECTRERFLRELDDIPIACRAYRLRKLQKNLEKAEGMNNLGLAMQIIKLAAKEVGDVYVNRRLATSRASGPGVAGVRMGPDYTLQS